MAHKTVYLIRHAATDGNVEGRYIGITDEELRSPARDVPEAGKKCFASVDRVITSPMKRAAQTAEILFDKLKPVVIDELKEIDFGAFEGKNHRELDGDPAYQAWIDSNGNADIPGGEKKSDFIRRSYAAFQKALGDPQKDEVIAIVCHGGNIMAVLSTLTGKDYYDFKTHNLSGYCLEMETDDKGIHDLTYTRFAPWDPA